MNNSNELIKDPYSKTIFNSQQDLDDFLKCCDPVNGYLYFMDNFFYIQHPTKGSMLYHPYEYQKRLINTYHNYRYSIALMPRQSGKCVGINTIVKLKNIKTNEIEEITIGKFYERISKMYDMSSRNEGVALTPFSQTQHDSNKLQNYISKFTNTLQEIIRIKFQKFFRKKKSWISTWRKTFSVFKEVFAWKYRERNAEQSRSKQKKEWITFNQDRLLVKKDKREYRRSTKTFVRKATNIFLKEMYRKLWGKDWKKDLAKSTEKMAKIHTIETSRRTIKNQFVESIKQWCIFGYGKISLCNIETVLSKYGQTSFAIAGREKDVFIRYGLWEKNNRISRRFLACQPKHLSKRLDTSSNKIVCNGYLGEEQDEVRTCRNAWLSGFSNLGTRLQEKPRTMFTRMSKLSDQIERKFIKTYQIYNYEIFTDTGWEKITDLHLTIPYDVYKIETESGLTLECADTHILFDQYFQEIFVKDLCVESKIQTINGIEKIKFIEKTSKQENMFDVTVDSYNHRFYSNGILSHNTTSAAGYLLWYAMFVPDSTILIAAHKYAGAQEIMQRIRYAYENCPMHIKAGVATYNKGSLFFDNGSRIVSATTTENTGRGMSISLLYCLDGDTTTVRIRNKTTLLEEDITLKNLYTRLYNPKKILNDEFGFVDEKYK